MTKRMLIGMLVCTAMLFGTVVQARGDDLSPGRWWMQPDLATQLSLSKKEKKALDNLFSRNRIALIDLRSSLEKERLEMQDILERDPLDEAALFAQQRRVQEKRQKLSDERFKYLLGVRKILGADRFRTLAGKYEEMKRGGSSAPAARPWKREGGQSR